VVSYAILAFVVSTVVALVTFTVYSLAYPEQTAADRLERLTHAEVSRDSGRITHREDAAVEKIAARLGRLAQAEDQDSVNDLRDTLRHAGFRSRRAVEIFQGSRVASVMLLPVFISPSGLFVDSIETVAVFMVMGAAAGYYLPVAYLQITAASRQAELLKAYPDALDLLVISVESGLGLDMAFRRVAREIMTVSPQLAREFQLVNTEISAGIERMDALRHLQERTGLDEVRSLVNMLQQAERYGTSIAQSLRLYSSLSRERRMAKAEEKAGQVSSKLTIIMILFLLPVLMTILLGPSAIRIRANFMMTPAEMQEEARRR
jgi:tight adherence protein C